MPVPREHPLSRARLRSLSRRYWAALTAVAPHDRAHWPALRVALCAVLPLVLTLGLDHPDWAPYAVFGSLASVYGRHQSYRARLASQATMGVVLWAAVVVGTAVGVVAPGSLLAVGAMALFSVFGLILSRTRGLLPVPSLFLVFALGTLSSYPHAARDLVLAAVLCAGSAGFAVAFGQVGRFLPLSRRPRTGPAPGVPLAKFFAVRDRQLASVAYLLGPLVAGTIATTAGLGHPYWAAVAATAPLSGTDAAARFARATHRLVGTLVGLGVAYLILAGSPGTLLLVAAVALFQVLTELLIARNYALAMIAVTPMALVLTYLGSPMNVTRLVTDRLIETLIGAAVTVAVLVLLRPFRAPGTGSVAPIAGGDTQEGAQ